MAGHWYFRIGQTEYGPCTLAQLVAKVQAGEITAHHWVREGATAPWQTAAQTPELRLGFEAAAADAVPVAKAIPAPHKSSAHLSGAMPALRATTATPLRVAAAPPSPQPAAPPAPRAVVAPPPPAAAPAFAPIVNTAASTTTRAHGKAAHKPHRKSSPAGLIIGVLGGAVALLLVAVVVAFSTMGASESSEATVAKKPAKAGATAQDDDSAESLADLREKAVDEITKWREAGKATGGLKNIVSFEVENVRWHESADNVLCVEISLTNASPGELKHAGWSSDGKHGAWLLDADNKFVASAGGSGRATTLAAGEKVTQVLEFSTPGKDFKELRLVLPYSAVARSGQWGYSIPAAMLRQDAGVTDTPLASATTDKPETSATAPTTTDVPSLTEPGDGTPTINAAKSGPAVPAPASAVADDDKPEDIRKIISQSKKKETPRANDMKSPDNK